MCLRIYYCAESGNYRAVMNTLSPRRATHMLSLEPASIRLNTGHPFRALGPVAYQTGARQSLFCFNSCFISQYYLKLLTGEVSDTA